MALTASAFLACAILARPMAATQVIVAAVVNLAATNTKPLTLARNTLLT